MNSLPYRKSVLIALLVAGCGAMSACSDDPPGNTGSDAAPDVTPADSAPQPPHDHQSPDAQPDGDARAPDKPDGDKPDGDGGNLRDQSFDSDASCISEAVVNGPSRFAFVRGFPENGLPDAGCDGKMRVWEFSPGEQKLTETRCYRDAYVKRAVLLTSSGAKRINDAVTALRTTCETTCITDYFPDLIQVLDGRGCALRTYNDNHTTGCAQHPHRPPPPYIAAGDLLGLGGILEQSVTAACDTSDAGNFEAGIGPGICVLSSEDTDAGPWGVCDGGPPDPQPPEAGPDADAAPDVPDGDAATCSPVALTTSAARFTFSRSWPENADASASCAGLLRVYDYVPAEQKLVEKRCQNGAFTNRTALLTAGAAQGIDGALLALRTTCARTCITDTSQDKLQLLDGNGCTAATFFDNHKTSCPSPTQPPPPPPYVESVAFATFWNVLESSMAAVCGSASILEAGVDGGNGTCLPSSPDTDAGSGSVCDGGTMVANQAR